MSESINKQRLTNLLKGVQKSIDLFEEQGHTNVYFNAQFFKDGKKQNGIERGDVASFSKQIRTYVFSEEAASVKIEFIDESSSKTFYTKVLDNLTLSAESEKAKPTGTSGLLGTGDYDGLGATQIMQVNSLVEKKVTEERRNDEFNRLNTETVELREKVKILTAEKEELAAEIAAKSDVERYMGIIGTIFPGLAAVFQGTRFANLATTLAGTTDMSGKALPKAGEGADEETQSIATMVGEFCDTLNAQEAGIVHMLFMAFEKDRGQMKRAFDFISQTPSPT